MALSKSREAVESVAEVFEADCLGAPFAVYLYDSVSLKSDPETKEILSYVIPNIKELLLVILINRVADARKLSGPEIKFLRKVLGLKQKDLAKKLEISVEHLSRHENGLPMTAQSEKFFRALSLREVSKFSELPESTKKAKIDKAFNAIFENMEIQSVVDAGTSIEMHFRLSNCDGPSSGCSPDNAWDENLAA